ncbi:MAG: OmpA family protein [Cytophagaceae bacterium]
MKIVKISLLILIVLPFSIYAQDVNKLQKDGTRLFKQEHYRKALPYFEQVLKQEPENAQALFGAAVCYLHRYSKEKALSYIDKAYSKDSAVDKHIHYWMGRVYHQNYLFDKALYHYGIYKNTLSKNDQRRRDLDNHMRHVENAREFVNNPQNYYVRNLGPSVNSSYSEHSPVTSVDDKSLIFTSRRESSDQKEDLDGEPFEDIFMTKKQANGEWSHPESIHLNTSGHDASIQLFDNDTKLLIYKFSKGGDIYYTEKEGDKWKDPQKFANINTRDFESDAFITADGKTAYFATNHYKKNGDLDIYYVSKNADGTWSKPQELKGGINSDEDEDAPFITSDGKTMYFSSRGHKNMGGYDVFRSTMDETGKWSEPENMGHPINTPDDDVYYYLSSVSSRSYLASYREGGFGEKDIYEIAPIPPVIVSGEVIEDSTNAPVQGVTVILTSLKKTSSPSSANVPVNDGKFEAKVMAYNSYSLAVVQGSDTLYKETFDIPFQEKENQIITKNVKVPYKPKPGEVIAKKEEPVKEEPKKEEKPVEQPKKGIVFKDINFEVGKADLNAKAKSDIMQAVKEMKKDPKMIIAVEGHTSAEGDKAANEELSQKRADAVRSFMIQNGITPERITAKGFGDNAPIASNDTEEGRRKNRRTEIKIVQQ